MKYIISEAQLEDLINYEKGEFDQGFYNFIASNLEVEDVDIDTSYPFIVLYICDKPKLLTTSKKHLVDVLVLCYGDEFPSITDSVKRLTAKKVIDDLRTKFYII